MRMFTNKDLAACGFKYDFGNTVQNWTYKNNMRLQAIVTDEWVVLYFDKDCVFEKDKTTLTKTDLEVEIAKAII